MIYLFAAYSIIFILLAGYLALLGRRQNKIFKEINFLKELMKE